MKEMEPCDIELEGCGSIPDLNERAQLIICADDRSSCSDRKNGNLFLCATDRVDRIDLNMRATQTEHIPGVDHQGYRLRESLGLLNGKGDIAIRRSIDNAFIAVDPGPCARAITEFEKVTGLVLGTGWHVRYTKAERLAAT